MFKFRAEASKEHRQASQTGNFRVIRFLTTLLLLPVAKSWACLVQVTRSDGVDDDVTGDAKSYEDHDGESSGEVSYCLAL